MSETKEFSVTDVGVAAFLLFVLSEDKFLGAEQTAKGRACFVFQDDATDDKGCDWLYRLYYSPEGARANNVREYDHCHRTITQVLKSALKAELGERVPA